MGQFLKYFGLFLFVIAIYTLSLFIFARGFLLKRVVIEKNSTCSEDYTLHSDMHGREGCWMHSRFRKAVIIVIDALKFDFLKKFDTGDDETFYKNKLPIVHKLLYTKPLHSRLYKFIADPPTTTSQRLKGLTTGSLPTFVDASSNFASSEIFEDNIINQFIKHGRPVKFLGDDTWLSLFPRHFQKAIPFPSFNVKDLHTVDNGILQHLYHEIRMKDWSILVAHFLGVDHCGHRFGPNHPAMAEKLLQMNSVISNITSMVDEDTIVVVLGDHGMTSTGDHGGDSLDELEAGLFIFSPSQIVSSKEIQVETVAQVDLVPTISLLLGIPIPFSNVGKIITELFSHCHWWDTDTSEIKQTFHVVKALRINAHQIKKYLLSYYNVSSDFPLDKYYELEAHFQEAEKDLQFLVTSLMKERESKNTLEHLKRLQNVYENYITTIRTTFQAIWAKFDLIIIAIGCLSLLVAVLINIYLIGCLQSEKNNLPSTVLVLILFCLVYIVYAGFHTFFVGEKISSFMAFLLGGFVVIYTVVLIIPLLKTKDSFNFSKSLKSITFNWFCDRGLPVLICVCFFMSRFSNSYIVYEDSMTLFLIQTMICIYCVQILRNFSPKLVNSYSDQRTLKPKKLGKKQDIMLYLTNPALLNVYLCLVLSACLRVSMLFRLCREEQVSCTLSLFLQPLSSFSTDMYSVRNMRYFFCVLCLIMFILGIRKLMRHLGNLNGTAPSVLCHLYVLPVSGTCCALYWAQQAIPQKVLDSLPVWQQVILPDIVYFLTLGSVIVVIWKPLCVFTVARSKKFQVPNKDRNVIPEIYQHFRNSLGQEDEDKPTLVYGLASAFSSSIINMYTIISIVLLLLFGDGLAPSIMLMTLSLFLSLEFFSIKGNIIKHADNAEDLMKSVVFFGLLCNLFFYNTGHQATVPSIRFEAAFVGFHGDFNSYVIPAALITLNTFTAHILCTLACPLLFMWPLVGGAFAKILHPNGSSEKKGDFILQEQSSLLNRRLFQLVLYFVLFHGIKVLSSVLAANIHRRHLMVWKIFAPRFVFESVMFFVVSVTLACTALFVKQTEKSLSHWCRSL